MSIFSKSTLNTPLSSVTAVSLKSGSVGDVVVTRTPATGLPFGSRTLPIRRPCRKAEARPVKASQRITRPAAARRVLVTGSPPRHRCRMMGLRAVYCGHDTALRTGGVMRFRPMVLAPAAALLIGGAGVSRASAGKTRKDCIYKREITTLRSLDDKHVYVKASASHHYLMKMD